jgi:hypothetical protein
VQNDNSLALSLGANEAWEFEAFVIVTAATNTPDFKCDFTVPTGATIYWQAGFVDGSSRTESSVITASATSVNFQVTGGITDVMHVRGIVATGSTAGTLQFRFAQNTSNNTATVVKANSFIRGIKN